MGILIELADQDYKYCLDYASGKTNIMALNNTNRIIEAVADGTQYENRLKADLEAILVKLQLEIHKLENPYPHNYDNLLSLAQHNAFYDAKSSIEDLVDEKINALKAEIKSQENEGKK